MYQNVHSQKLVFVPDNDTSRSSTSDGIEAIAGHVTAGGTVCLEALSQGGSRSAWKTTYDVVSVLQLVPALHPVSFTDSAELVQEALCVCSQHLSHLGAMNLH